MKKLVIFILTIMVPLVSYSQWVPKTSHTAEDLYEIDFLDQNFGVAVGDNGTVVITENMGDTWTLIPTNISANLRSIKVISKDTLLVASGRFVESEALISYDGGSTFTKLFSGYKIGSPNEDTYTIVERNGMMRSDDRAKTWSPASLNVGPTTDLDRFSFVTDSVGYLMGNVGVESLTIIFGTRTDDAGKTWGFFDTNFLPNFSGFSAIAPLNKDSAYVFLFENINFNHTGVYQMFLFHEFEKMSSTGTYSFTFEEINFNTEIAFSDVHFFNNMVGFGTSWDGSIYKTTDGGKEWGKVFNFNVILRDLLFLSENLGFAIGDEGNINRYYIPTTSVKSIAFEDLSISPNPTNDFIKISTKSTNDQIKATLISVDGRILIEKEFIHSTLINVQDFHTGIYFLNLKSDKNFMTERIIIK